MGKLVFVVLTRVAAITTCFGIIVSDYKTHDCFRDCRTNVVMTCEYNFTLEYYFTLTKACYDCPYNKTDCQRPHCVAADGTPRAILVANRMLPGPAIHVCKDDMVKVNVHNRLENGDSVTIHWHGVHQKGFPHMDGAPMITQCPIPVETSFQYRFPASNPGTHFWHSHIGFQRSDGLFGAIIVREPQEEEEHLGLYDFDLPEHTVLITDWLVELTINKYVHRNHVGLDTKPVSMLINGKGIFKEFEEPNTGEKVYTPYEVFNVTQGRRYRFRVISNGVLNCPIQFSIDNHTLIVIASDGNPFKKLEVESLNIFAGERYDIVLNADQNVSNYWLRARGLAVCGFKKAHQQAIIRYNGAAEVEQTAPAGYIYGNRNGKKLNPWNKKGTDDLIQVSNLEALIPTDKALKETPDKKFYLAMDFYDIDNFKFHDPTYYPLQAIGKGKLYTPQINHITSINPPAPLLTQFSEVPKDIFCNENNVGRDCTKEFCECVHHLKVGLDDTVELIVIDEGQRYDANHPMHLHGHSFRVVGMDRAGPFDNQRYASRQILQAVTMLKTINIAEKRDLMNFVTDLKRPPNINHMLNKSTSLEEVMELDRQGLLQRNLTNTPAKDTVTVPDGGYTILRFHANNPGFWLFHCHLAFDQNIGMGLVIQVGELNQMTKTPKHFPRCGKWQFSGYEEDPKDKPHICTAGVTRVTATWRIAFCVVVFLKL